MLIRVIITTLIIVSISPAYAAWVDTIAVFSPSMNKEIKTVVIQPDGIRKDNKLPVLYLLHGYSGNYSSWITQLSRVREWADTYRMIIVCPDGGYGSWYWDIDGNSNIQYETFITKELTGYIEANYPASAKRNHRGISGLSMGGYGALYLALRHQNVFGAVGSTSGGVDFRPWRNSWGIQELLGSFQDREAEWNKRTIINMLHLYQVNELEIFIDCGTSDFFYEVNEVLHEKMSYLNISHRYFTMPGKHDWEYWGKSMVYQIAFFSECFDK